MAENSENSASSEKVRTRKTASLTADQSLEILQASLIQCQRSGLHVQLAPVYYPDGERRVAVIIADCELRDGHLMMANAGNGERAQPKIDSKHSGATW